MQIGKFRKAVADRKKYTVDYVNWLESDETITAVAASVPAPADDFYVDMFVVDTTGKLVVFYVSGGLSSGEYRVVVKITTSENQIKEDWVTFVVT